VQQQGIEPSIRIGLCGLGTVGSGVFNLLTRNGDEISRKTGHRIEIVQIGCRRDHPDCDLTGFDTTQDIFEVVDNPNVDLVLELIGGTETALELVRRAIANKKHVVTANKALIAEYGEMLFAEAEAMGVSLKYEAAIAGGIPIVKAIREGLAGNRINALAGIINGTTNYILTEMELAGNRGFDEVLKEAQDLGYAEADPTFDVEGVDAAHKLTILSSIAFGVKLKFDAIYMEGISKISVDDIKYAAELGYRIKHLGITRRTDKGIELRVHPALIESSTMLAQVSGVMNAVLVNSDAAGQTLYVGAGAGAGPTASSVVADIIDVTRAAGAGVANLGFVKDGIADQTVLDMSEIETACYLRLNVIDKAGVMATLSTILSNHDISIESLIQKDAHASEVPIVIITNVVLESAINAAIAEIEQLDVVRGSVTSIRVTSL